MDGFSGVALSVGAVGVIYTAMEFLKNAESKDWKSVRNQLGAWLIGVGFATLFHFSQVGDSFPVGSTTLRHAAIVDVFIVGLAWAGVGGVGFKAIQAKAAVPVASATPTWGSQPYVENESVTLGTSTSSVDVTEQAAAKKKTTK